MYEGSSTVIASVRGLEWRLFRIRTESSSYELAMRSSDSDSPVAVLRGASRGLGNLDLRDSNPTIGGRSLFEVPPCAWPGNRLEVSSVTTSPVVSVDEVVDRAEVTAVMGTVMRPSRREGEGRHDGRTTDDERNRGEEQKPYPENIVEGIEASASLLRHASNSSRLARALQAEPRLLQRFRAALLTAKFAVDDLVARERASGSQS